jgi:hypothetical protein
VHFIVAALGRDCDDFTLHIYASLAEAERRMISERIKAALARSKKPLGLRNPSKCTKTFLRRLRRPLGCCKHASMPSGSDIPDGGLSKSSRTLGLNTPWVVVRVRAAVRRSRESVTKNSWAQRCSGWPMDRHTATRVRIAEIWKRHPEFSARQVVRELGSEHPVRLQWVQKILSDCFQASTRLTAEGRQVGRRFYHA